MKISTSSRVVVELEGTFETFLFQVEVFQCSVYIADFK